MNQWVNKTGFWHKFSRSVRLDYEINSTSEWVSETEFCNINNLPVNLVCDSVSEWVSEIGFWDGFSEWVRLNSKINSVSETEF